MKKVWIIGCICLLSINMFSQQQDPLNQKRHKVQRKPSVVSKTVDTPDEKNEIVQSTSDTLTSESDTLVGTSETSVSLPQTQTVKTLILPKGAKDTSSLSFKDTDLRDIFRALAVQHNLNISVDNSVNKRVTISLSKVQVYEAIKFICEQNNLNLNLEGGIFKINPLPAPQKVVAPPKIPWVYYGDNLLSVKLKNDDLEAVILEIQKKAGKNILIQSGTTGSVSGTLNDIDFDIGFTQLLNNNGFAIQKKNGMYIVSRLDYFVGQQTGAQGQRGGAYWISVKDSLVTVDVTNAQLDRVLADIVRQLNTDVVFYNTVTGTVTARANNLPLSKTLDMILRNTNFSYRESEGMYFIGEKTNKALMATKLIKLKYLRSEKILDIVPQSISSQATIKVMKEHNGVVIVAPGDVIAEAEEFFQQIDKPVAQVLIEAIVVEFNRNKDLNLGVSAGYIGGHDSTHSQSRTDMLIPGIDIMFSGKQINDALQEIGATNIGKLPDNFFAQLKAMEDRGWANIKSRPLLATLNGQPATLSIGTTFYFKLTTTTPFVQNPSQTYLSTSEQFQTVEADRKMEITPYVGADGQITVELKPDFKVPNGQPVNGIPPTIDRRAMSSTLVIKEGETVVLGGLIEETESESKTQVPFLGSIPLLGYIFSSTSKVTNKTELVIYVTPHISYGEAFHNVSLPQQGDQ